MRNAAIAVLTACVLFLVVSDVMGRLFVNDDFRVSDLMLGSILGALLVALGLISAKNWPSSGGGGIGGLISGTVSSVIEEAEQKVHEATDEEPPQ